jgi:lactoylglutathione lyase
MTFRLQIDHVSLMVRDLEASAAFYRDVLGLSEIANGTGRPQFRWFGISEIQALHIGMGEPGEPRLKKGTHFALSVDDLDGMIARLDAAGVAYGDWPGTQGKMHVRPDGVRGVYLEDPDGHWIEINDHR